MRPWLFVICFSLGVTLMLLSGYLPQSASAHGSGGRHADYPTVLEPTPRSLSRALATPDHVYTLREDWRSPDLAMEPAEDPVPAPPDDTAIPAVAVETPTPEDNAATGETPLVTTLSNDLASELASPLDEVVEETSNSAGTATLTASAGADRVVWIGWKELVLDGSGSRDANGSRLRYTWRQTAGPAWLEIEGADRPKARVTGFSADDLWDWHDAVYEFELTVTNAEGAEATDSVACTVKVAPPLKVSPRAERFVQERDGYRLGHYEAWQSNSDSYAATFEVRSDIALTFTRVAGNSFELVGEEQDRQFIYLITVYGQAGEAASFVEFLVDTADRIPGVLVLNVTWEGR